MIKDKYKLVVSRWPDSGTVYSMVSRMNVKVQLQEWREYVLELYPDAKIVEDELGIYTVDDGDRAAWHHELFSYVDVWEGYE